MPTISLHPSIDKGIAAAVTDFEGGTLICHCQNDQVVVEIKSQSAHNHACGCTKCWKPVGALFSVVAVVPRDKVRVASHPEKLVVVDPKSAIQRHACMECGVHLYGRIENQTHAFHGLDFVHTELSPDKGWSPPGFAAFVSSIIESGFDPERMTEVRGALQAAGLDPYDCLSPTLMDFLSTHAAKASGILQ